MFVDPRAVGNPSNNQRSEQYVQNPDFAAFIAEELVPAIDAGYRTQPDRDHRVILGTSLGGLFSAYLGLLHPDVFNRLAIQSPAFWVSESPDWWTGPSVYAMMADAPDGTFMIHMSTGTINDTENGARQMRDVIESHDHVLTYREVPEGHSWGNWRALLDEMLMALLPGPAILPNEPTTPSTETGLRLDSAPNPARGTTRLRFTLPEAAEVSLACFDVRGRLSQILLDGERLPAGDFYQPLTGPRAAGTYACRLQTTHGTVTRLVTLMAN